MGTVNAILVAIASKTKKLFMHFFITQHGKKKLVLLKGSR